MILEKSLCKGLDFKKAQTKTVAMQIPRPYSGRTKKKKTYLTFVTNDIGSSLRTFFSS